MIDKKTASFMRSLSLGNLEEEILIPFPEPRVAEKETLGAIRQTLASMLGGRDASSAPGTGPARCRPRSSAS